jgi:hypothetical protein
MITGLADVATSGSYQDLDNKPSLATVATTGSYQDLKNKPSLATVATTGSYQDLTNKPTIPSAYTHPATHSASMITGLATVATTGSYQDLSNKPTIPSAYTHPTTAGNKHIPSGGSSGQFLGWSTNGTATWVNAPSANVSTFNGQNSGLVPKPTESSAQLFLDATGDWAAPQVFQPSTNTGKRFLTGTSSATQRSFINTHEKCYMQDGYLYSGGNLVISNDILQSGTCNTTSLAADERKFVTVTFSPSYVAKPHFIVTSHVYGYKVLVEVATLGATDAMISLKNNESYAISNVSFSWIAIGTPAG